MDNNTKIDWTKEWFTGAQLLTMADTWDDRLTFHDKVCPEKQIIVSLGPEKSLKSSTAIELALALTCPPQQWYGIEIVEPMKVLYLFFEGEPGELKNKMQRAQTKYPTADINRVVFKHFDVLALDTNPRELADLIATLPFIPDIIFIDPWANCIEDENNTKLNKKAVQNVMSFDSRWFVVHHRGKPGMVDRTLGESARGSGILVQKAHTIIGHIPHPTKAAQIALKFRGRGPRIPERTIEIDDDGVISEVTPAPNHPFNLEQKAQIVIWKILTTETNPMVTPEYTVEDLEAIVAKEVGTTKRTVKTAWQKMANLGIIRERQVGREKLLNIFVDRKFDSFCGNSSYSCFSTS